MSENTTAKKTGVDKLIDGIERFVTKLPPPAILFCWLFLITAIIGCIFSVMGVALTNPASGEVVTSANLFSKDGVDWILGNMVKNFTGFAPLGLVITMTLGIGLCEESGMLISMLNSSLKNVPAAMIPYVIAFVGTVGNIASDTAMVVIPPMAAIVYMGVGKHPVVGMMVGYAGAQAGFTANLMVAGTDTLLQGLTNDAIKAFIPDTTFQVDPTCNWFFMIFLHNPLCSSYRILFRTYDQAAFRKIPRCGSKSLIYTPKVAQCCESYRNHVCHHHCRNRFLPVFIKREQCVYRIPALKGPDPDPVRSVLPLPESHRLRLLLPRHIQRRCWYQQRQCQTDGRYGFLRSVLLLLWTVPGLIQLDKRYTPLAIAGADGLGLRRWHSVTRSTILLCSSSASSRFRGGVALDLRSDVHAPPGYHPGHFYSGDSPFGMLDTRCHTSIWMIFCVARTIRSGSPDRYSISDLVPCPSFFNSSGSS